MVPVYPLGVKKDITDGSHFPPLPRPSFDVDTTLAALLQASGVPAHVLTGKLAADERGQVLTAFRDGTKSVLVATSSLVGEGFDCPELDTLYLASPTGNATRATQALGRVLRPSPGKTAPMVYDLVDSQTPALERAWRKRVSVYRRHQAEFRTAIEAD